MQIIVKSVSESRISGIKSVVDFGAKGDDIADDSNAVQAAINSLYRIEESPQEPH